MKSQAVQRLLIITPLDVLKEPNHRVHHLLAHCQGQFQEPWVLHYSKVFSSTFRERVRDAVCCRMQRSQRDGITYVAVDPFLNHPDNTALGLLGLATVEAAGRAPMRGMLFRALFTFGGLLSDGFYLLALGLAFFIHVRQRMDVCVVEGPLEGCIGLLLRGLGYVQAVVYQDIDNMAGRMHSRLRRALTAWLEHACMRRADLRITVSQLLAEKRRASLQRPIVLIPNGVDYALFQGAQIKPPHPPTLIYMGNVTDWANLGLIISVVAQLQTAIAGLRLLIVGRGTPRYMQHLHILVQSLGMEERVGFIGPVSYACLPTYLSQADIGLALFEDNPLRRYACPLKVFEYAAAGLPVVGTRGTEAQRFIDTYQIGEAIEVDAQALYRCLRGLLSDRERYDTLASNARSFAQQFDWKALMADELRLIGKVCHGGVDC